MNGSSAGLDDYGADKSSDVLGEGRGGTGTAGSEREIGVEEEDRRRANIHHGGFQARRRGREGSAGRDSRGKDR